jgi:N-acetylglucosamine-6-phosphate deacetylase
MSILVKAGTLLTPSGFISNAVLAIDGDTIVGFQQPETDSTSIDLSRYRVLPGLIDMHIHGARGYDVMDGTPQAIYTMSEWLAQTGVTSFLGTTVTAGMSRTKAALENIARCSQGNLPGARLLGAYLEGPYIGLEYRGAHHQDYIRPVDWEEIDALIAAGKGIVKVVALAPEKAGSVVEKLVSRGIKVAMGHSNATYAETMAAIRQGASLAVHIFNGMRSLHHREPGIVGAALTSPNVFAELIADGVHVAPAVMDIVKRCKGVDGIVLISDCIRAGGLADGVYTLGELDVTVKQGIARVKGSESLAGSTLKLLDGVRNMVEKVNTPLADAVAMASLNVARALGVDSWLGSIELGKRADLIAIDDDYNVVFTMVGGKVVFDCRGGNR